MSKIIIDMSVSLDGFVAGENDSPENMLGDGGEVLHEWLFSGKKESDYTSIFRFSPINKDAFDSVIPETGAMIVGRRTYNFTNGWNGNHPIEEVPIIVLTHQAPLKVPNGKTPFTFVSALWW